MDRENEARFLEHARQNISHVSFGQMEANRGGFEGLMGGAMVDASASTVSVWHYIFPCFRKPGETTVCLSLCVCVCVFAYVLGPSPEPMYYKCSHCKIIFGFSRLASNYYWHLILFAPFTDPLTTLPIPLTHMHTFTAFVFSVSSGRRVQRLVIGDIKEEVI